MKLLLKSIFSVSCVHPGTHKSFHHPTLTELPRLSAYCLSKEWAPIKYIFGWHGISLELCMIFKSLLSFLNLFFPKEMLWGLITALRGASPWNNNQLFHTQATGKQTGCLHLAEMAFFCILWVSSQIHPKDNGYHR